MSYRLKSAMIDAIAQEWESNPRMNRVVELAWHLYGKPPADDVRKYTDLAKAVNAEYIAALSPVRVWVGKNLPRMGDALLDRRPREACVAAAMRELGGWATSRAPIRARSLDKRSDWGTCK